METVMLVQETRDEGGEFRLLVHEARNPKGLVLFAVGAGGGPERHGPLLEAFASAGHSVVAPSFERIVGGRVTQPDLELRARRLGTAVSKVAVDGAPLVGVGHSIGAATLLMLAGAQGWMGPGQRLPPLRIAPGSFSRLMLMCPPTGFFQGPGSLDELDEVPTVFWSGELDRIVRTADVEFVAKRISGAEVVEVKGADHFSFMDERPPTMPPVMDDQAGFLGELHQKAVAFVDKAR